MRMPWPAAVAGILVAVLGAAGLVRGAVPLPAGVPVTGTEPIVVSGAYVRAPAPPTDAAAAYFTVFNTTGRSDRLISVDSGAGATTVLHTAGMTADVDGAVIPAHGKLVLSTGHGHVMIEKLFGQVRAGQTVNLNLTFEHAGVVSIVAKVVALGAPAPTTGAS
jgi:periplasmic copper chaperone A